MSVISDSIPNLVNGVSQQVYAQRLPSQAELQENFESSVVDGLKKRPPTRHRARLTTEDWGDAYLHTIDRDPTERYAVAIAAGTLRVFDLDGAERTVAFPDGAAYLAASDPNSAFRAVTVADFTFIVNRDVAAAMAADLTPARPSEALINVRQGNYGRTYKVTVDGVERASVTTPDGSAASHAASIDTTKIADDVAVALSAALPSDFTVTRYQNAVHVAKTSGDFSIAVEDGFAGDAMTVAKERLQSFHDLPNFGPDGFHVEIVGDDATAFDNYYVRFEKADDADSAGVWREAAAQGARFKLDAATLPHVLVREADGGFTFRRADWAERAVGDAETAPEPSFVGRRINDVFFFRNRLGLLSDENVVLSRAGEYFNYWPKTVTALVDSDPIDVAATTNRVSILRQAVPYNRSLLVFADQTQFVLTSGDLLTPRSAALLSSTEYAAELDAKPVLAGRNVYFVTEKGAFAGVREYFIEDLSDTADAVDVTQHVPRYIPGGVFKLTAAPNETMLVALSRGARDALFVYRYLVNGPEKLQASWSKWTFDPGDQILNADFVDTRLLLIIARADGVYLEELDIDAAAADPGASWLARMDRKVTEADCALSYSVENGVGWTVATLPYAEDAPLWAIARTGDPTFPEGYAHAHERPSPTTLRIKGDLTGGRLLIGRRYTARYVFSPFLMREVLASGASSAIAEGRLQILYLALLYEKTGAFRLVVRPKARGPFSYAFTGRVLGADANRIGAPALETGRFKIPVYARNTDVEIRIETDSFLPAAFTSADWEATYAVRSRRV